MACGGQVGAVRKAEREEGVLYYAESWLDIALAAVRVAILVPSRRGLRLSEALSQSVGAGP
eukprot:2176704-Rhodomonas_salina.1